MSRRIHVSVAVFAVLSLGAQAQVRDWTQQFGTSGLDIVRGVARSTDGALYAGGYSNGALGGPNAGASDAFVARLSSSGEFQWTTQFGSSASDFVMATAPDGAGGCFVAGFTLGSFGSANAGGNDAWLARVDASGAVLWTRQLGTAGSDIAFAAAADGSGGVFVSGSTRGALGGSPYNGGDDAFVARFTSSGDVAWIWQAGGFLDDAARAVVSDGAGGCFVAGSCSASSFGPGLGGLDAWLARLDEAGQIVWSRQAGTAEMDSFEALAADGAGGVLAAGQTLGSVSRTNAGAADAWLARFDASGAAIWSKQFGTTGNDVATSVAADMRGGWAIGGKTRGALIASYAGGWDAWTMSVDSSGAPSWAEQFGTSSDDEVTALCIDATGGVFIGGLTLAALGGASAGSFDALAAHYPGDCGVATPYCTSGTSSNGCVPALSALGVGSSNDPVVLTASGVEGERAGVIFYGVDNTGFTPTPWSAGGSSFLCVKSPTQRTTLQSSGGSAGGCDGQLALDWTAFVAANPASLGAPFVGGEEVFAQAWYRDPPAPKSTSLSNAVRFRVCP